MSEDESVSDNERVLEIANESLLLCERIPKSKIMRKVLRSLPGKFDMKVTAIDEAHDITKLKLDELFGSLLTFEMAISHRENKKGKVIAFKLIYEEETTINKSDNEANMNESIALLMKHFSKVVKKFKNLNTTGSNARNLTNYRRRDGKNNTRRFNEISNMRDSDYGRKKKGEGRIFRCRECEKVGHYRAKCPTFSRRQKKIFCANLSDEDTDDSEKDNSMNAFTACTTETNSGEVSKNAKLWKCKSMHLQQRKLLALQLKLLDEFVITVAREVILGHFAICYKETECINRSGCSKHMTGKRSFFSKLKECAQDMLLLEMIVEGLKANLISVSQLCDQGYNVKFSNDSCVVMFEFTKGKREKIVRIRSDHGKEFENEDLSNFCKMEGIHHEYSAPLTPQ
ncbi:uncharacterized protein LOC103503438 [Cucumis melo]|uniref:Uncharacterized protein LOC103503438 n=1 Tax=Cucumis melo TaxID=3656 RepID=A0A1S3CPU7_CUCME|nr:uncharacterized protein LOC103503438 [Cucumis melo]